MVKKVKENNQNNVASFVGYLFIGVGIIDFMSSHMGFNFTSFLGELSRFTPIAFGLMGSYLINLNNVR